MTTRVRIGGQDRRLEIEIPEFRWAQRVGFGDAYQVPYSAILLTSENSTLVLDEPDVFAFPPYPKTLGEMIANDSSNQFFLTTHNPYFLSGIIEKTPADRLAVFVCYRDPEGATAIKLLTPSDVSRVIEYGASVFFNLDQFLSDS